MPWIRTKRQPNAILNTHPPYCECDACRAAREANVFGKPKLITADQLVEAHVTILLNLGFLPNEIKDALARQITELHNTFW